MERSWNSKNSASTIFSSELEKAAAPFSNWYFTIGLIARPPFGFQTSARTHRASPDLVFLLKDN
jgi:hypothetical protein